MTQRHVPANRIEICITITALYFLLTFACSLGVRRFETLMQK